MSLAPTAQVATSTVIVCDDLSSPSPSSPGKEADGSVLTRLEEAAAVAVAIAVVFILIAVDLFFFNRLRSKNLLFQKRPIKTSDFEEKYELEDEG